MTQTIAILSPGMMGRAVGAALKDQGHRIVTCLAGRGEATQTRAKAAGFEVMPSLEAVVEAADLVLSILPPVAALTVAQDVADAMRRTRPTAFADCNAVSPETTREIGSTIADAGGIYIDGGIVGAPPATGKKPTRFYVSGIESGRMQVIAGPLIAVREVGDEIGRASAIKMCYAALTKGTWTLQTACLVAAEALGIGDELHAELQESRAAAYGEMESRVPRLPLDAGRWIGEMNEIAATLSGAGVTPKFHEAAAGIFEFLDTTPIAAETRETVDASRTLRQALAIYVETLKDKER